MNIKLTNKPNETLYLYCRVSTSGQEKDGSSLDVQKDRGIKLSKELNLSPIVIQEQGSGMKPYIPHKDEKGKKHGRVLFTELMDGLEDGFVKNVWIDEETRLTRLDTDIQYIHIQMKKMGVNLFVGSSTIPKKWDWITDLVDTIITKVNQNQIRTQVRKSIRSKRKLFQEGCYMKGDPPFGYELIDKKLSPHPINKDWVVKIFDWYDKNQNKKTLQRTNQLTGITCRTFICLQQKNSIWRNHRGPFCCLMCQCHSTLACLCKRHFGSWTLRCRVFKKCHRNRVFTHCVVINSDHHR